MLNKLTVQVNSARKTSEFSEVMSLVFPTLSGEVEILPDHMPLITELDQGVINIQTSDGKKTNLLVSRGYARVINNQVNLLLDEVDQPDELVKEEIEAAIQNAQKMISTSDLQPSELIQLEKRLRYEKFKLRQIDI